MKNWQFPMGYHERPMQPTDDLKKATRLGSLSVAKVMRALLEGPCTAQELHEVSGLHIHTIHEYMRAMRKEKILHICAWEEETAGRESFRVYKLGGGVDVPRRKKSKNQVMQELRARKKKALLSAAMAIDVAKAIDNKQNGLPVLQNIKRGRGRPKKDPLAKVKRHKSTAITADHVEID
jgi:hypothetical protein